MASDQRQYRSIPLVTASLKKLICIFTILRGTFV
jgi:hypothetical protein